MENNISPEDVWTVIKVRDPETKVKFQVLICIWENSEEFIKNESVAEIADDVIRAEKLYQKFLTNNKTRKGKIQTYGLLKHSKKLFPNSNNTLDNLSKAGDAYFKKRFFSEKRNYPVNELHLLENIKTTPIRTNIDQVVCPNCQHKFKASKTKTV